MIGGGGNENRLCYYINMEIRRLEICRVLKKKPKILLYFAYLDRVKNHNGNL